MKKYNITVSPDFKPDKIAGWYIFNTYLQQAADISLQLNLYDGFEQQRKAIADGQVDLIYANPFDAAMLVNEYNFKPLVKPAGANDECVVVTSADSAFTSIDDLVAGTKIAATDDPAINMIGMRMLEPANLNEDNTETDVVVSFIAVAKQIMDGKAQVGFILKEAFDGFSNMVKSRLKVLVVSEIDVIYHGLMAAPSLHERAEDLSNTLMAMNTEPKGKAVLEGLGFNAWEVMDDEDAAFMIDLMETLRS